MRFSTVPAAAKGNRWTVSKKLDVLIHECGVHADKQDGEGICEETNIVREAQGRKGRRHTGDELLRNDDTQIKPHFCNLNMDTKDPEKKVPPQQQQTSNIGRQST